MRKKKNTIKEETPDSPMRTCKQVNTHKLREREQLWKPKSAEQIRPKKQEGEAGHVKEVHVNKRMYLKTENHARSVKTGDTGNWR